MNKVRIEDEALIKEIEKRAIECGECYIMIHHEDSDKWAHYKNCPRCGKETNIILKFHDQLNG